SMDYAVLISVIVGITNLAPTFGPLAGALIGGFILIFVNPWWALWFIRFTIILQTIDGYIIKPRLFGNSLGISSLWILVSIIVFGRMFGVAGILLAIPSTAIFDIFYKEVILRRLEKYKEEKLRLREEEKARKEAEAVAIKAAKAAIRAVIKKENVQAEADDALKEKLASNSNANTNEDDI
ncbi:MAG: AI-2E family transporter, partial [Lachnospiraceae bacterium]|nr:AI-2E family transporter [Lachnospiraceae bacterium]